MGAWEYLRVYVRVPGSHTCSYGQWAPVGHVLSRPSAGLVGLHMYVEVCPARGCTYTHAHTSPLCKRLSSGSSVHGWGLLGHQPRAGSKRSN